MNLYLDAPVKDRREGPATPSMSRRIGWLVALALVLLGVAHQRARRQVRSTVLRAEATAGATAAADADAEVAELVRAVRQQVASVQKLSEQGRAADAEIEAALHDAQRLAGGDSAPAGGRGCPPGCTEHGNCNGLTGECTCGLTRKGAACQTPTMPACSLEAAAGAPPGALAGWVRGGAGSHRAFGGNGGEAGWREDGKSGGGKSGGGKQGGGKGGGRSGRGGGGEGGGLDDVVNLSYLTAETFWAGLRDMRLKDDPRRTSPGYRWVGMVTCACVEQVKGGSPPHAPSPFR